MFYFNIVFKILSCVFVETKLKSFNFLLMFINPLTKVRGFLLCNENFIKDKKERSTIALSDCRKTLILIIVPIKSADIFKYGQSKGTLFLAKRPLLKNSPQGYFINSPLVNTPSTRDFRSLR